jgi:hypothetical protein
MSGPNAHLGNVVRSFSLRAPESRDEGRVSEMDGVPLRTTKATSAAPCPCPAISTRINGSAGPPGSRLSCRARSDEGSDLETVSERARRGRACTGHASDGVRSARGRASYSPSASARPGTFTASGSMEGDGGPTRWKSARSSRRRCSIDEDAYYMEDTIP